MKKFVVERVERWIGAGTAALIAGTFTWLGIVRADWMIGGLAVPAVLGSILLMRKASKPDQAFAAEAAQEESLWRSRPILMSSLALAGVAVSGWSIIKALSALLGW